MTYAFNFTFTRPDENDATVYAVGMNVEATTQAEAERMLRDRNDHLTITSVQLFAILTDDGDVIYSATN